ncbi:MAG: hypothetical protein HC904_14265 [Blastochloris sp.]|nr:hypothetical protein [Blastochloris sp.]
MRFSCEAGRVRLFLVLYAVASLLVSGESYLKFLSITAEGKLRFPHEFGPVFPDGLMPWLCLIWAVLAGGMIFLPRPAPLALLKLPLLLGFLAWDRMAYSNHLVLLLMLTFLLTFFSVSAGGATLSCLASVRRVCADEHRLFFCGRLEA